MPIRTWVLAVGLGAVLLGGFGYLNGKTERDGAAARLAEAGARAAAEPLAGDAVWAELEQAVWFAEGAHDPERMVYIFLDPQCPYCNLLWRATLPYLDAGLQVRNIVVAYLTDNSQPQAEAILGAEDPVHANALHQRAFKEGGIAPLDTPNLEAVRAVEANSRLFHTLGVPATPAIFYRDEQGAVQRLIGLPDLSMLADVFGLPEQAQTDPALAHY